jgi:DNA (cytosine-5)-methyltransferase 1
MKVLSLFSGIGAPEQALKNIGIKVELVGFSEIDKFAIKSYCAIHEVDEESNLGDVTTIKEVPKGIDLIVHGSPCQSISISGYQHGADEGSSTRSSLMWETVRICEKAKPKYVLWENVKNILSSKHKHNFEKYLNEMERMGYKNFYKVLNAKDFGVPQNRERVFVISIRKDIKKEFVFPRGTDNTKRLKDVLEKKVEEKFYMNKPFKLVEKKNEIAELQIKATKSVKAVQSEEQICPCLTTMGGGHREPKILEVAHTEDKYEQNARIYGKEGLSPTLAARDFKDPKKILEEGRVRKLTPRECWRLMGFKDEDFEKAQKLCSNSQLYKQAGNSIVVNVLEEIFKEMFKSE